MEALWSAELSYVTFLILLIPLGTLLEDVPLAVEIGGARAANPQSQAARALGSSTVSSACVLMAQSPSCSTNS